MKKVCYLAGGFHSDWQERTMKMLRNLNFYTPKGKCLIESVNDIGCIQHGVVGVDGVYKDVMSIPEYKAWDLFAIRNSDIVFLYHERTHPGFADCMEAAYAKGLGKTIVICTELENTKVSDRYIAFVESFGDIVFHDYVEAINFLTTL